MTWNSTEVDIRTCNNTSIMDALTLGTKHEIHWLRGIPPKDSVEAHHSTIERKLSNSKNNDQKL